MQPLADSSDTADDEPLHLAFEHIAVDRSVAVHAVQMVSTDVAAPEASNHKAFSGAARSPFHYRSVGTLDKAIAHTGSSRPNHRVGSRDHSDLYGPSTHDSFVQSTANRPKVEATEGEEGLR